MQPSPSRVWQLAERRYRLLGSRCKVCGATSIGPRILCPSCGSDNIETISLPRSGKVYSYTIVNVPPAERENAGSYVIAIIELDDGTRLTAEIVDCDPSEVYVGMPVELTFRKIGEESKEGVIYYGYKFRPLISKPS